MKKFSIYFIWLLAIVVIHSGPAISDETLNDVKNRIEKSLKRDLVGIAHVRGETYNVGNQKEHKFELLSFEVDKDGYLELHWNVYHLDRSSTKWYYQCKVNFYIQDVRIERQKDYGPFEMVDTVCDHMDKCVRCNCIAHTRNRTSYREKYKSVYFLFDSEERANKFEEAMKKFEENFR
ncbi:MAG: hypothetical protein PVG35_21680 [Desulfobacterales bacterium]|jgi:hypothetical protein